MKSKARVAARRSARPPLRARELLQRVREMLVGLLCYSVVAVVLVVALATLLCFVVALYEMLNLPENRGARLTLGALFGAARGWLAETVAAAVALIAAPLDVLPWPVARSATTARPPIVFVPGWLMTPVCFWPLRLRLARGGWRAAAGYRYRTLYGDLRRAAEGLHDRIEAVCAESGAARVVVVAHGIGGVVARLYLREQRAEERVAKLVTLGAPHQGSKLFALAVDPMLQDLRPGTALVDELCAGDDVPQRVEVTAIYAGFDLAVVPASAGQYPRASSIEVEGVGHMGLLWSSRVYEIVRENLEFVRDTDRGRGDAVGPTFVPVCGDP